MRMENIMEHKWKSFYYFPHQTDQSGPLHQQFSSLSLIYGFGIVWEAFLIT